MRISVKMSSKSDKRKVDKINCRRAFFGTGLSAGGFTLLELLVVSILVVTVVVTTAGFWRSLSLSMNDLTARTRVVEEMRFLVENISRDFGPDVGAMAFDSDRLLICQDSGKIPNSLADWDEPDIIVEYFISNGQLRQFDQSARSEITVGDGISVFLAEQMPDLSMYITVGLQQNDIVRQATFMWNTP